MTQYDQTEHDQTERDQTEHDQTERDQTERDPERDTTATVAGEAEAEAEPDIVRLFLRVEVSEPSAPAATDAFAHALAAARALLEEFGCSYLVQSTNSWTEGRERRTRHRVAAHLQATLTAPESLPALVERVLEAEKLQLSHLEWALTNERQLRREARTRAIAEAREAADDYAAAIDLRVAQVLAVNDPGTGGGMPIGRAMMAMASGGPGERPEIDLSNREPVKVHGSVVVTFLLRA